MYNDLHDYITQAVPTENLYEAGATEDQIEDIAATMLVWHEECNEEGKVLLNRSGYVEREDVDFWEIVEKVLES